MRAGAITEPSRDRSGARFTGNRHRGSLHAPESVGRGAIRTRRPFVGRARRTFHVRERRGQCASSRLRFPRIFITGAAGRRVERATGERRTRRLGGSIRHAARHHPRSGKRRRRHRRVICSARSISPRSDLPPAIESARCSVSRKSSLMIAAAGTAAPVPGTARFESDWRGRDTSVAVSIFTPRRGGVLFVFSGTPVRS